ncbi:MAG: NAD-glutamate dehydrogenase [Alphaproteobacteria bacterium]|nr:MAG: NAD-glutamate dehydrogenase [Alphaproteobacteria bacterium]
MIEAFISTDKQGLAMSKSPQKDRLIQNALIASRDSKGVAKEKQLLHEFLGAFYQQVPADDLTGWKAEDLSRVAGSMCDFGAERKLGNVKLRVFNPEQKRDGWHIPHTVIQIVNDDMPFIIDSIVSELTAQSLSIEVLFHPILSVARDGEKLRSVQAGKVADAKLVESYVYIQLEQMLTSDACRKLAAAMEQMLADVRAATADWRKMIAKVDAVTSFNEGYVRNHDKHDVHEAQEFLGYLKNNNFTFLGYREYKFTTQGGKTTSEVVEGAGLGILRNGRQLHFGLGADSPEVATLKTARWPVMVSKLISHYATVHRRVPLDALIVKMVSPQGDLTGMHLFVGLFTSSTYSCRTSEIPMVRQKVSETVERAGFIRGTHDYKALEHILEKMPRDELFQVSSEDLAELALGVLHLQIKQRVALFSHLDPLGQHMSCLIYVPRDRYNTNYRLNAARILEQGLRGKVTNYFTTLDDSAYARVLFTVRLDAGGAGFDHEGTEALLIEMSREWDERLKKVLIDVYGKIKGAELAFTYGRAFPANYHESILIGNAVHDIRQLETMIHNEAKNDIRVEFYRLSNAAPGDFHLKVYHESRPVPLSEILPVLENLGFRSMSEMPYEVKPQGYNGVIWIHDFLLRGDPGVEIEKVKSNLEETFQQVWRGRAENDGLNQLVLRANLSWREVMILRTYSGYMRQARSPYSRTYIEQTLSAYPLIARELVEMFKAMHDPKGAAKSAEKGRLIGEKIVEMLQNVQKLDHDRILRNFKTLIEKTLRTSYYQTDAEGNPKAHLAVKLDSRNIAELPLPRPHVEIYVYSTRVEAVHLRGGEIARGGIRWSDRHEDFRTEVLSLMKAQGVKNTVIVPVGAKGGFVVKQPPKEGGREAYQAEGIECYKIFVQALLDLTDNNVKGKVVRPKDVVCHDGIDPYLVVAADKGTATFSDIANGLSLKHGFWLADAFASGGKTGYDHKGIAITARGGWECVKRHFREMGKDIQKEPFTCVGVGDMAGDVFGNAMLLSKQMRLLGAFNHVHIFCDPNPDAAETFAERQRMFKNRLGWDGYDKSKISTGGGVFERSAKTIKLSSQIKKCFGIDDDTVTPDELIKAILKAEADLMWLGGIGTFVKSSRQSNADADDKSNDNLRVDGRDLRVKVVGEGANLGTTQLSRVEYAQQGGRINTDFIDNSGGVDCSDHEVNIKILLSDVMAKGKMTLDARNKLMEEMTEDVAALVLRDNYQQSQSLSLQEYLAKEHLGLHADFIRSLEKSGLVKRSLEGLPDDETLNRLSKERGGLTRPELCILTSWGKIDIYNELLKTGIPDDPANEALLFDYFPKALHKYAAEIKTHKLRREIIATQVVNTLVNRMGPVFVLSRMQKTGAPLAEVVKAFMIVTESYSLNDLWKSIEALDNKVPARVQIEALNEVFQVAKRTVTWCLRFGGNNLDVAAEIEAFRPGVELLQKSIAKMVPMEIRESTAEMERDFMQAGMPAQLAAHIATIKLLSSASDIISIARRMKGDIKAIAETYFHVGEKLGLGWLRLKVAGIVPANSWQARVMGGLTDDFYIHQAALTSAILAGLKKNAKPGRDAVEDWFAANTERTGKIAVIVGDLKTQPKVDLEMLVLASQRIGQLAHQAK